MTKNVSIDASQITDWNTFHDTFAKVFGFPDFYGHNMSAWNDCMTYLDDPDAGMTSFHVAPGDVVVLCILEATDFGKRCPDIYDALIKSSAFVNYRRIEMGEPAVLALSFFGSFGAGYYQGLTLDGTAMVIMNHEFTGLSFRAEVIDLEAVIFTADLGAIDSLHHVLRRDLELCVADACQLKAFLIYFMARTRERYDGQPSL